jgi:acetylornithine deacetylase ArgE
VVDYIENTLRHARIDCERQPVEDGRENIIAIVDAGVGGGSFKRDGLMLCSHMDTVPVANMSIDPFDPAMRDGRVYGRGACDAKGPIAAMLAALINHAAERGRPAALMFAATVNEEFSFTGAWKLIEREWPVSASVVGEPTNLSSIVAHKGVARWRVRVGGMSAHGATPEMGRSAIYDGARVALALEDYASELAKRAPHPLLGRPTINLGRVWGGQAVNIVPDACELEVERRLLPGEDGIEEVRACAAWVRERVRDDVEVGFDDPYLVDPALDTPRDSEVVRALDAAHKSLFGEPVEVRGAHYGTDGSKLARAGIETVVCGPGDIAQAHTKDEFIEIEQVEMAVRLYQKLAADWPRLQN